MRDPSGNLEGVGTTFEFGHLASATAVVAAASSATPAACADAGVMGEGVRAKKVKPAKTAKTTKAANKKKKSKLVNVPACVDDEADDSSMVRLLRVPSFLHPTFTSSRSLVVYAARARLHEAVVSTHPLTLSPPLSYILAIDHGEQPPSRAKPVQFEERHDAFVRSVYTGRHDFCAVRVPADGDAKNGDRATEKRAAVEYPHSASGIAPPLCVGAIMTEADMAMAIGGCRGAAAAAQALRLFIIERLIDTVDGMNRVGRDLNLDHVLFVLWVARSMVLEDSVSSSSSSSSSSSTLDPLRSACVRNLRLGVVARPIEVANAARGSSDT